MWGESAKIDGLQANRQLSTMQDSVTQAAMQGDTYAGNALKVFGNLDAEARKFTGGVKDAYRLTGQKQSPELSGMLDEYEKLGQLRKASGLGGEQLRAAMRAQGYGELFDEKKIAEQMNKLEDRIRDASADAMMKSGRMQLRSQELALEGQRLSITKQKEDYEKSARREVVSDVLARVDNDTFAKIMEGKKPLPEVADGKPISRIELLEFLSSAPGAKKAQLSTSMLGGLNNLAQSGALGSGGPVAVAQSQTNLFLSSISRGELERQIKSDDETFSLNLSENLRNAGRSGMPYEGPQEIQTYKINGQEIPATFVKAYMADPKNNAARQTAATNELQAHNLRVGNLAVQTAQERLSRIHAGDQKLIGASAGKMHTAYEFYNKFVLQYPERSAEAVEILNKTLDATVAEATNIRLSNVADPKERNYLLNYYQHGYVNPSDPAHKQIVSGLGVNGLISSGKSHLRELGFFIQKDRDTELAKARTALTGGDPNKGIPQDSMARVMAQVDDNVMRNANKHFSLLVQNSIGDEFKRYVADSAETQVDAKTSKPLEPEKLQNMQRLNAYLGQLMDPANPMGKGSFKEITTPSGEKKLVLDEDALIGKLAVIDAANKRKGIPGEMLAEYTNFRKDWRWLNDRLALPSDTASQLLLSSVLNSGKNDISSVSPDTSVARLLEQNARTTDSDTYAITQRVFNTSGVMDALSNPTGSDPIKPSDGEYAAIDMLNRRTYESGGFFGGSSQQESIEKKLKEGIKGRDVLATGQLQEANRARRDIIAEQGGNSVGTLAAQQRRLVERINQGVQVERDDNGVYRDSGLAKPVSR